MKLTIESAIEYVKDMLALHKSSFSLTGNNHIESEIVSIGIRDKNSGYETTFDVWLENGKLYGEY